MSGARTVRRRLGAALAVASALSVVLTVGVHPTFAAWVSTAKLGDSVGVASSSCTTAGVYRTTASGRFLRGSVAGVPLSSGGALAALTADNDASTVAFPSGATPQGGDGATSAVTNAAAAGAVRTAGGVAALTAPSGSQTQYAAATSTGRSAAGAGAVTSSGVIDAAGIAARTRPSVGDVDVSSVLAAVPGGTAAAGDLSQLGLSVGRVASSATLDECARRWGASLSSALTRTTALSGLSLTTKAAAVSGLLGTVTRQRAAVSDGFADFSQGTATSAPEAAIAAVARTGIVDAVTATLSTLGLGLTVGTPVATVTVTSPSLAGVASAADATVPDAADLVRLDGTTGRTTADLTRLGTWSAAPNTGVLSASDVTGIATAVGDAAGTWTGGIGSEWDRAIGNAVVDVDVQVPVLGALGATVLTVRQHGHGALSDFITGSRVWDPLDVVVIALPISLGSLLAVLTPQIATKLLAPVQNSITPASSTLTGIVASAESALAGRVALLRSSLPAQLAPLSTLFSITLNEQPTAVPGGPYRVTALRIRVAVAGADALDLGIANSSVGPDRTVNE